MWSSVTSSCRYKLINTFGTKLMGRALRFSRFELLIIWQFSTIFLIELLPWARFLSFAISFAPRAPDSQPLLCHTPHILSYFSWFQARISNQVFESWLFLSQPHTKPQSKWLSTKTFSPDWKFSAMPTLANLSTISSGRWVCLDWNHLK